MPQRSRVPLMSLTMQGETGFAHRLNLSFSLHSWNWCNKYKKWLILYWVKTKGQIDHQLIVVCQHWTQSLNSSSRQEKKPSLIKDCRIKLVSVRYQLALAPSPLLYSFSNSKRWVMSWYFQNQSWLTNNGQIATTIRTIAMHCLLLSVAGTGCGLVDWGECSIQNPNIKRRLQNEFFWASEFVSQYWQMYLYKFRLELLSNVYLRIKIFLIFSKPAKADKTLIDLVSLTDSLCQ